MVPVQVRLLLDWESEWELVFRCRVNSWGWSEAEAREAVEGGGVLVRDAEGGGVLEVCGGGCGEAGAGAAGIVKNASGGNRRCGRICLLELGSEVEDELPLLEEALLSVELGRAVFVCFVYVVVDVVAGGELGRSMFRACLVERETSVVALAARFGQSGVGSGSAVALGALAFAVTVAGFIGDAVGSALQALDVGFELGALGLALGPLDGGGVNESLVGFGPFVNEGVPLEQLGGEDVGRKVGRRDRGCAGVASEEVLDVVLAASEANPHGVELKPIRGGELLSPLNGITGKGAALEDGVVESAPSATAVVATGGLDDVYGGS
jgi:hypothetical protein